MAALRLRFGRSGKRKVVEKRATYFGGALLREK
jgi:hypothetical protein